MQSLPLDRRHLADYRDEIEHSEVARILSELPAEHPARVAYSTGAREAADSISPSWLVADRRDLVQALVEANLAAWRRTLARQGGILQAIACATRDATSAHLKTPIPSAER
jgi:hypothetical protein